MNREKAYEEIANGGAVAKPISKNTWLAMQELVKRAAPMKVDMSIVEIDECYGLIRQCPHCKDDCILRSSNYCMNCGQALDWSDGK